MSLHYYIATKLERHADHNLVRDTMAAQGHTITYDWTTHGSVREEGSARMREAADGMVRGVLDADLVIVLLPGGRGTHAELGMALAAGIPVILHAEDAAMFESPDETICFYHHPLCLQVVSSPLDELWRFASHWQETARLGEASEIEWLTWFAQNADFGPGDGDEQIRLREAFEDETGKRVPKGWRYDEEG